jgi:hypothetical protein
MTRDNGKSPVKAGKKKRGDSKKNNDSYRAIMKMTPKSKIAFIIPVTDNSGNAFGKELFDWVDTSLCDLGGGFHHHPASGGWAKNGVVQYENSRKYHVGIEENEIPKLLQVLIQAKQVFHQEELYVELKGDVLFL